MKTSIWGQTLVKNEDKYIYFSVESVIKYLDKLLLWDTGSKDETVKIIQYLKAKYPLKIDFKQFFTSDPKEITNLRQRMLNETRADWFILVDGDEVWWEESIKKVIKIIDQRGNKFFALVNPVVNLIGDIYHYQEEEAGEYRVLGRKGHFNIRAIKRHEGLRVKNDYPLEGYFDKSGALIQNLDDKLFFVDAPILHFTHLSRSTKSEKGTLHRQKFKYEIGKKFPSNFKYPEVFYQKRPDFIKDPWIKQSSYFIARAIIETPLKKIKRKIFK